MIIDWKKIARKIYDIIKKEVEKMDKKPTLQAILVWNNPSSLRYIAQKEKRAKYCSINFNLKHLDENITEDELLKIINNSNNDKNIDWYIVQLPLPKHINEQKIINAISPEKDVDWFHEQNQWKILIWDKSWFVPCTPAWIMKILESIWEDVAWKIITVVWKSNIVWKPITALLINAWATVISCNSKTPSIEEFTKKSDIVIMATWIPWLLKASMINDKTIVIDVWFTIIDNKIYWDAEFDKIEANGNKITPVPWGVWALTVAMLMSNTLKASTSPQSSPLKERG